MYIRTVKNNSGQAYYQLVESFRHNGQVRKRVLLTLGRIEDSQIEDLAKAIRRHQKQLTAYDRAKQVSVDETFILGPLLVLEHLFKKLGINQVMRQIQDDHPRLGFNLTAQLLTLAASRFIRPSSKLKVYDHWVERFYPEMVVKDHIKPHTLYRTIDVLARHKEEIEHRLYRYGRDLLNLPVDIVLYDLTTLRFESTRTDLGRLRKFGYSKEMRTDCTQVVFGLLVDPEGIPLGFEVYPGNTFEGDTLKDIVKKMRAKFQVRRFIFVGDRGLFSKKNLELLSQDGTQFIVGMKLGVVKRHHEEFYDLSRFRPLSESLYVYETEYEGDRLIVTWSRARYQRDQKARGDILEKILRKLASRKVRPETFISNRSWRRFVRLDGTARPVLNDKAIAEDAKKDGFFGVVTDVKDMSAEEIVMHYKDLWKIEDAFGEFKGTSLKARPVFHWKDRRIIGHLTLCFLAYLCEAYMTKVLRQKAKVLTSKSIEHGIIKERPLTVAEVMKELGEVRAVPVRFGTEKTLWVRTDINGNAAQLFSAIGMRLPPKILKEI